VGVFGGDSIGGEPAQRLGEAIDRVVGPRRRAVAAAIRHFELIGLVDLLGQLHGETERPAVAQGAAAALVDGEFRIDQVAMVRQQPAHAVVRRIRQLLVGGQRQDDVAVGPERLLDVADQVGDEDRRHRLVVDDAAVDELERVGVPVLAPRFHHVEMGKQEERPARAGAAQPRHQVALAGTG